MFFRNGSRTMTNLNNIGFMQGRLSPAPKGKIQFFPHKYWENEFYLANRMGLKNMEWTLDYKNLYKNPIFKSRGVKKIKHLSKKYLINITTLTGDCFMQKPFWKFKKSKKYLNDFKNIVKACNNLKIRFIVFPLVDNSSIKNTRDEKKLIHKFSKLRGFLKKNNVTLLFESDFPPLKLKEFIKKFDQKIFGINYDSGNSASLNYNCNDEFKAYGKYIKNIHIKDRIKNGKTIKLGMGNAKFKKLFKNIKNINYKKLLILQTARTKKNDDYSELEYNFNFIKKYLN